MTLRSPRSAYPVPNLRLNARRASASANLHVGFDFGTATCVGTYSISHGLRLRTR